MSFERRDERAKIGSNFVCADRAEWEEKKFRVVDTGGIIEEPVDPIEKKMQTQVKAALDEAQLIVFV